MQSFAPGQVWTYQTRPQEGASRIVVCRVENDPRLGEIVHIHVSGLRMKSQHSPSGMAEMIGHMPYSSDALRQSVEELEAFDAPLPDFEEGYEQWRLAFDQGKGGIWTIPLADAIAGMEQALRG